MYQHSFNCTVSLDSLIMIRVADRQWCKSSYIQYISFLKSKTTEYWATLVIKSRGFSTGFLPVFWRQKHSTFITIIWNSLGQKYHNKEEKSSWTFVVPLWFHWFPGGITRQIANPKLISSFLKNLFGDYFRSSLKLLTIVLISKLSQKHGCITSTRGMICRLQTCSLQSQVKGEMQVFSVNLVNSVNFEVPILH